MTDKNADQIKAFYTELSKIAPSQDWEKILKVAKKILGLSVNEKKAIHCKVVCLIHLDKFDEALGSIERCVDASDLAFEKAYCEYRLNKIEDAYATLKACKQMNNKENELMAQIAYKLEKYQESYDCYRDLVKNVDDDYDAERQTNLSAVVASLRAANPQSTKDLDMSENEKRTYELCYNSACISISKENYEEAHEKLKRAENLCKETFEDDQEDPEALESEIAIIRIQLAYCLQKLGKSDEALKVYNSVLKNKPSDVALMAVASNNLVCLNKDQNVFDSKKRIKAATASELDLKLNSLQRRIIAYNEILFSIMINQKDVVNKLFDQYKAKFDDKEKYGLLRMILLYKEKKYAECEKLLVEIVNSNPQAASSTTKLYLVQILLLQGKINEACDSFKTLDEYKTYKLGIVSSVVTLLKSKNDNESISSLFADAINYYNKKNPNSKELEIYIRENSNFQIACGNLQRACEMLEKMRSYRPNDFKILSKLINIYSKFDNAKAKKLSEELPSLEDVLANSNIDIDTLETQFTLLNSKYGKSKSINPASGQMKSPDAKSPAGTVESELKKKKKKKRKIRLPKDYNPGLAIDPERWIPLRERSYYKGKRNKKRNTIGKGTQGAVSGKDESSGVTQSPKPTPGSPSPATGAAAKAAAAAAAAEKSKLPPSVQQKKKKKHGGKW